MSVLGTRTATSSRANTIAQVFPLVANYGTYIVVTPYIITVLGFDAFGVWAVTGAIGQYAALFDLGISRSATRFVSLHYNQNNRRAERGVVGAGLGLLAIVGSGLAAIAWWAAPLVSSPLGVSSDVARVLLVASVTIAICGLSSRVIAAAAFGRERMVAMNYVLAIAGTLWQVVGVIYLWYGNELSSFAVWSAVGSVAGLVLVAVGFGITERRNPIGVPTLRVGRDLVGYGLQAQAVSVADLLVFQFAKIALGMLVGPAAAAAYEIASRLAAGARSFGVLAGTALTPKLTAVYAKHGTDAVLAQYYRYAKQMTAVSALPLVLVCASCVPFLKLWLGEYPSDTAVLCIALSSAYLLNVSTSMSTVTGYAIGRPGAVAKSALLTSVINVLLVLAFINLLGTSGVVIAILLSLGVGSVFGPLFVGKVLGEPLLPYVRAVSGPLLAAFVGGSLGFCVAFACLSVLKGLVAGLISLAAALAVAGVSHLVICRVLHCLPSLEFRVTMRSLFMMRG